ncbi:MAG: ABC transporter ATP-binding protein [Methanobacteriota archaeon]|nr:MAG: ABC transporter ATP-binding protein [Euryarchaeota archaeon]
MDDKKLMTAKNVYAIYRGKDKASNVVALHGINLEIYHHDFLSIVGTSGSGKSTLLRILGGLQKPSAGTVQFQDIIISELEEEDLVNFRRKTLGYVFQEGNLIPFLSAKRNLMLTLQFAGTPKNQRNYLADEMLKLLDIYHVRDNLPSQLSGGEKQRVAIGRALITRPNLILADEPTGNLDYENSERLMGLFKDIHKEVGTAFLIVTHSQHVAKHANRTLELIDGRLIGEHGAGVNISDLSSTRKILFSDDGSLTLPPEILPLIDEFGNQWIMDINFSDDGSPTLIFRPNTG